MVDKQAERLAGLLFERFSPPLGAFGKATPIWADAAENQREAWTETAVEILDALAAEEELA